MLLNLNFSTDDFFVIWITGYIDDALPILGFRCYSIFWFCSLMAVLKFLLTCGLNYTINRKVVLHNKAHCSPANTMSPWRITSTMRNRVIDTCWCREPIQSFSISRGESLFSFSISRPLAAVLFISAFFQRRAGARAPRSEGYHPLAGLPSSDNGCETSVRGTSKSFAQWDTYFCTLSTMKSDRRRSALQDDADVFAIWIRRRV